MLIHCTKTPYRTLARKGVDRKNLHLLHYGDKLTVNGFQISVLHGRHAILPKATLKRLVYILKHPAKGNIPFILRENRVDVENDETLLSFAIPEEYKDGRSLVLRFENAKTTSGGPFHLSEFRLSGEQMTNPD